ncbi:MAG: cystathionine gamma-synthase [Hyphomonadaceae bacterium]|nr:cystathionine gamma-synthase [Hyphomonadaceae bacterium]
MTKISNINSPQTRTAQAGIGDDPAFNAVTPPLYTSSTYVWPDMETKGPYDYGRTVNPTRDMLARALTRLEGGAGGVITNSGMAAVDLCLNLINADALVLAPHDCYGGTHRLLTHRARQGRLKVVFVNQADAAALDEAFAARPAMVLIETPSNPLMRLVDIDAMAQRARNLGAISVCDNTFMSPARQNPLAFGCHIVLHSTTKYINGHSDVVGGAVIAGTSGHAEQLHWWANTAGLTGAPFDSWLTLRGLKTLHARMDVQEGNARALADYLAAHDQVDRVYYPGLESDPGYNLARQQQSGPGAMLSFEIAGDFRRAKTFLSNLHIFQLAASLGGTESLICQPALMTHAGMDPAARREAGIQDNLIRVSAGMEALEDLIADFERAFQSAA